MSVSVVNLLQNGPISYHAGWELQKETVAARQAQAIGDTLLLLEHEPTVTYGKTTNPANLLLTPGEYTDRNIALVQTDRGGDATYHGPGQLVAYPIVHLGENRRDLHRYVRLLEAVVIAAANDLGVPNATRADWHAGVWVGDGYLAALGVKISRWVTHHGVALNVTEAVREPFSTIVPCGVAGKHIATLETLVSRPVTVAESAQSVAQNFERLWASGAI